MSQTAGVNYVHYSHATDSSTIEVNQVQQIKRWLEVTETSIPAVLCCRKREGDHSADVQGKGHVTDVTKTDVNCQLDDKLLFSLIFFYSSCENRQICI